VGAVVPAAGLASVNSSLPAPIRRSTNGIPPPRSIAQHAFETAKAPGPGQVPAPSRA